MCIYIGQTELEKNRQISNSVHPFLKLLRQEGQNHLCGLIGQKKKQKKKRNNDFMLRNTPRSHERTECATQTVLGKKGTAVSAIKRRM